MLTISLATRRAALCASLFLFLAAIIICASARPLTAQTTPNQSPQNQTTPEYEADKRRAFDLLRNSRYTEALAIYQRLAAANPSDAEVQFRLGFAQYVAAQTISNAAERRQARVRARAAFLRARELGYRDELLDASLDSIPPDGSDATRFSANEQADAAMREGEAFFARGDLDAAFSAYERALRLDPRLYAAALYAGDMLFKKGLRPNVNTEERNRLMTQAGEWFARAIAIDPNIETAYRYWGSALMEQGRMTEAREKVVEAYITEPYARLSPAGLGRWAQMNNVRQLSHPEVIGLPAPLGSLSEEAAALRARVADAQREVSAGRMTQLDSSLATLARLDSEGLLESYIFLARANRTIAGEYQAYARANRDKLRRYVLEYVIGGGAGNRNANANPTTS